MKIDSVQNFSIVVFFSLLDIVKADDDNDPVNILETFDGIGPFIFALLFVIFCLHLLIQPNWAMIDLMKSYLEGDTVTTVSATVLDCEQRPSNSMWLAEVMWDCKEHNYPDNPSMKFRHPDAYQIRQFARRFEFEEELAVGAFIGVILPRGIIQPRSGCPTQVVERILEQEIAKVFRSRVILGVGLVIILVILGFAARQIRLMDDPLHGWVVLFVSLVVIESLSLLYCGDQFLKKKVRVFDAARPMISVAEQQERREREAAAPAKTADPFSIPLHDFAGHARATERRR